MNSVYNALARGFATLTAACGGLLGGCASPPTVAYRAERYSLDLQIEPQTHTLVGRARLDLVRRDDVPVPRGPVALELRLHPDLRISALRTAGARLRSANAAVRRDANPAVSGDDANFAPVQYLVPLTAGEEALSLYVDYEGRLEQDVQAGESLGEIHNFRMRAHIGPEGVYLADGFWYPQVADDPGDAPLCDFTLSAEAPPGFELQASGRRDAALSDRLGTPTWRSPYPLPRMVLVGGPHEVHRDRYKDIELAVHLKPQQSALAAGWLAAAKRVLERYEPLLGPYPAREFTIVDNFFSSGFAFPCFTLLSSAVIEMGERAQTTHGYLDHEMLHGWWGNGVFVDPRDGNWCESLTSFATNYYGFVLDGNEEEARRKRRNYAHQFSRLKPEDDKPLGAFDRPGGCSRQIAYEKGAMVFQMLAQKMGDERFWAAMRKLTDERLGKYASWDDLRTLLEAESRLDLGVFFEQWVRGRGAPTVAVAGGFVADDGSVRFDLTQSDPPYALDVPVRLHDGGDSPLQTFTVAEARASLRFDAMPGEAECFLEVDPDYRLFRRIPADAIVPTTAATRRGAALVTVLPDGPVAAELTKLQDFFQSAYDPARRTARVASQVADGALAGTCALILGEAVRDPRVNAFLSAIQFPVTWTDDAFGFEGGYYNDPGDAVLCTVRHPGVPGGGITVVYANSEAAIPRAMVVPMYEHSLVIFRDGRPALRRDFERPTLMRVDSE